jgi:hypothetical protein
MINRKISPLALLCVISLAFVNPGLMIAQETIDKEVQVVKPYEPSVPDAPKISQMPRVQDTVVVRPDIRYAIFPKPAPTDYEVSPIGAAKMMALPLAKLYKTYIRAGYGNYQSPLLDVYFSNLRSKKYQYGVYFNHHSAKGKVKLANDEKVFAGYGDTRIGVYGKRFFKNTVINGDIGLTGMNRHYYGYRPDIDTVLFKGNIRQSYTSLASSVGIESARPDSSKFRYHTRLYHELFQDKFDSKQHMFGLDASAGQLYREFLFSTEMNLKLFKQSENLDSSLNVFFRLSPSVSRATREWRVKAGFHVDVDANEENRKGYFFPTGYFQFNVLERIIVPFFGVDGFVKVNDYASIIRENPFTRPDLRIASSVHFQGYAGIKGLISNNTSYNFRFTYSEVENMHFFVNDSTLLLQNQFVTVQDNVEVLSLFAEVVSKQSDKWSFIASGTYDKYEMTDLLKPWHKPSFTLSLVTRYNLRDKILASLEVYHWNKRYAPNFAGGDDYLTLPGFVDVNLGLEYRYTKVLSGFVKVNNLTADKYAFWNQYPVHRFNLMLGFTYSL